MTMVSEQSATDEVVSLVARCLEKVMDANKAVVYGEGDPPGRLFFPRGIEVVYVRFKINMQTDITFALSGPDAKYPAAIPESEKSAIVGDGSEKQSRSTA
jgi:hypothetical protein